MSPTTSCSSTLRKGQPKVDILVAFGVEDRLRGICKMSEEPKAPGFVLETLPPSTFRNDFGRKRRQHRQLGVREYWIHDSSGDLPVPRLAGWRLPANEAIRPDEDGRMPSAVLGLALCLRYRPRRFYDPEVRRCLPSQEEEAAQRRREAAEGGSAAAHAEARNAELEA